MIRRLFRRPVRAQPPERLDKEQRGPHTVRRWEAAESNRLNQAHWQNARGNSINVDWAADMERIWARCAYEAANNPFVEGVIATHQTDLVGAVGPQLQVHSDSSEYNTALEGAWREWYKAPTTNPKISGTAMLKLWIRDLWAGGGEILGQKVTKQTAAEPVKMRIRMLPSRRLGTPADQVGDPNVVLGIHFTDDGEPLRYWISKPERFGLYELSITYEPVPAEDMIHEFLLQEEDQARGVPWLACSLEPIGELRDYDAQVLDAARAAADWAVVIGTKHPDAPFVNIGSESTTIERRTISSLPPGYEATSLTPPQPATQYVNYRRERQAEIGRPVSMPLMMVRLDSSGHNYSSARFDGQVYYRALRGIQHWLSGGPQNRGVLNDLVDEVAREARFALPARPENVRYEWTWPVPPHVDPAKEGMGERIGLENGTLSFADACMARGTDEDTLIAKHLRTNEKRVAADLPPLPPIGAYPKKPLDFNSVYSTEDEEETENQTKSERSWANAS